MWKGSKMTEDYLEKIEFKDKLDDYILEMDIQNYSQNTLKTYTSILNNFYNFLCIFTLHNSGKNFHDLFF